MSQDGDSHRQARIDRLYGVLLQCLRDEVDTLADIRAAESSRIDNIRRMCAMVGAGRTALADPPAMLARLREAMVELPIPGGWAEFSFQFWRDLNTIAHGGWELQNLKVLRHVLRPGHHVIDVGAHVGHVAIYAAHLVGVTGRVLAIEPGPKNQQCLRANLTRNCLDSYVEAIPMALGDRPGAADLFEDGDTAGTEYSLLPNRHGTRGVACRIPVTTLDELVNVRQMARVDLVKIDTEGTELAVLQGGAETLRRDEISLLIELHAWAASSEAVCQLLWSAGFTLYEVRERLEPILPSSTRSGHATFDHIFATRKRAS